MIKPSRVLETDSGHSVNATNSSALPPISEYGEADLTGASYTKGAIAVYVLHEIVGDDSFKEIFRVFVDKYQEQGAKIKDFVYLAQEISKKDLKRLFDEWVYGVESSGLMLADITLEEIVRRYR